MFKVWVANLGKYNEGYLIGEWWNLEDVDDFDAEFEELRSRIGLSDEPDEDGFYYEEHAVFDWECDLPGVKYTEYPNLEEWWEMAHEWVGLDKDEQTAAKVYDEACSADFRECIDSIDKVVCTGCEDMYDVAYNLVHDYYDVDKMGNLSSYIDYNAIARDLDLEGTYVDYGKYIYEVIW